MRMDRRVFVPRTLQMLEHYSPVFDHLLEAL